MQDKHLYEYAVIRVVPRVEREEFINVGVILFSKRAKYIKMIYTIDEERLQFFSKEIDLEYVMSSLEAFAKIVNGAKEGSAIASLDIAERFRWLTAVKSASIQTSRPHPGFSENLDNTIQRLYEELVL